MSDVEPASLAIMPKGSLYANSRGVISRRGIDYCCREVKLGISSIKNKTKHTALLALHIRLRGRYKSTYVFSHCENIRYQLQSKAVFLD